MTALNVRLAYSVLDYIDAHPEQWRQSVYIGPADCGTAACFAGWVCLLSGERPDYGCYGSQFATVDLLGGKIIPDRAQELLGASRYLCDVTDDMGDDRDLFWEGNDREELGEYVAEIFGPRPAWMIPAADCSHRDDVAHDHNECLDVLAEHPEYLDPRSAVKS